MDRDFEVGFMVPPSSSFFFFFFFYKVKGTYLPHFSKKHLQVTYLLVDIRNERK